MDNRIGDEEKNQYSCRVSTSDPPCMSVFVYIQTDYIVNLCR
jgi:hypothetical protein